MIRRTRSAATRRILAVAAAPLALMLPAAGQAQQAIHPIVMPDDKDPLLADLAIPANAAQAGMWSRPVDWPIIAIHASVLPDGRVLTFGAPPGGDWQDGRTLVFWDPRKGLGANALQIVPNVQNVDSFCASATLLSDGTLLASGGASNASGYSSREGMRLDWKTSTPQRDYDLTAPRWYGTMTKLPDGRAIITGGGAPYANADPNRPDGAPDISSTPEVYTPGQGWRSLLGAYSTDAFGARNARWWYPRQWVTSSGTLFGISTEKMWEMRLDGNGSIRTLGDFRPAPALDRRINTGPTSTAVMYDTDRILQVGGGGYFNGYDSLSSPAATMIDLTNLRAGRVATRDTRGLYKPRQWANAVVLPNGQVLVIGGSQRGDSAGANAVYTTETWNPANGVWTEGAAAARYRGYHSISTLLPNGTVLTAGGGAPGPVANLDAEIYYPAYLFARAGGGSVLARRPRIVSLSKNATGYGDAIDLQLATGDTVSEVSLIAVSSVTHSFDSNQRRMKPAFTRTAGGVRVAMPATANLAPPGYYELAVVDAAGVPSVAAIVAIGAAAPPAPSAGTTAPPPAPPPVPGASAATEIGHSVVTVAAGADGTVGIVNTAKEMWVSRLGADWRMLPAKATDLAVIGENRYYSIGLDRAVYRWSGTNWVFVGRDARQVAAAADGTVAVVNADNSTVWIKRADDDAEAWTQLPGALAKKVAVMRRGAYYFVGTDDNLYRSTGTGAPVRIGRTATDVAASSDQTITVVSRDGTVWRKVGDTDQEAWSPMPFKAVEVATPDGSRSIYSNEGGTLFRR